MSENQNGIVVELRQAIVLAIEAGLFVGLEEATRDVEDFDASKIREVFDLIFPCVLRRVLKVVGVSDEAACN